ncbi:hypothetical protein PsYK624_124280 [Phanerochaete sordida]|uniref:F-box domain-containing protein n=1 Tax=Phanerochaete sordida TaxID=48140 RepID=A0A9P3LJ15_9APHY|nr:hypothetical protein PsYK624_124280 [Phanerochaete sordida]
MDLRLYELEERSVELMAKYGTEPADFVMSPEAMKRMDLRFRGLPYSFIRLCDTVKGFHTGYLDLTGRHEYRYLSAFKVWDEFRQTVIAVLRTARPVQAQEGLPVVRNSRRTLVERGHPNACILVDTIVLQKLSRWRLPVRDLDLLLCFVEDVQNCMEVYPLPKYQRLRLLDLPNEVLHRIARRTEPRYLRKFGSACKLLRDISWPTLHEERKIGLPVAAITDARAYRLIDLSWEQRDEAQRNLALAERKKFFQDANAICTQPETAQNIRRG